MNGQENLASILAELTPDRLRGIILGIAKTQSSGDRSGVSFPAITDALTGNLDLGSGAEGWAAQLKLKEAIVDTVASIPDMQYVEGDA